MQTQTVGEIEELLKDRDAASSAHNLSSPVAAAHGFGDTETNPTPSKAPQRVDKKVAEQRIEEDRERHKRLRENIWAVPPARPGTSSTETELEQLWEDTSDLGEDDYDLYHEEADDRARCGKNWVEERTE